MVPETKQMSIPELIDAIVPYIRKEHYSDCYIRGLEQCFNQFEKYCAERKITQLTSEVTQQFLLDQYGLQPGTVILFNHKIVDKIYILMYNVNGDEK